MDRRTAIKYVSTMTGVTLSSAFVTGFLSGCKPEKIGDEYIPMLLNLEQYQFLKEFTNVLIPPTDTPGAVELGVPETLETIAAKCYNTKDQQTFKKHVEDIKQALSAEMSFLKMEPKGKELAVLDLEETLNRQSSILKDGYQDIKAKIASIYLSTSYVGKELLEYLPVPGAYEPCIPLSSTNGKAYTYG